ncbi:MAG: hypothetical protein ACI82G_001268, partial [Bradymonadia bacterium]
PDANSGGGDPDANSGSGDPDANSGGGDPDDAIRTNARAYGPSRPHPGSRAARHDRDPAHPRCSANPASAT